MSKKEKEPALSFSPSFVVVAAALGAAYAAFYSFLNKEWGRHK